MRTIGLLAVLLTAACGPTPPSEPEMDTYTDPQAPAAFRVRFETTQGEFIVESRRSWAPGGVDRFHALVEAGYFTDCAFFRVLANVVQFGIHADPDVYAKWRNRKIPDDERKESNTRGTISFAAGGPNTRTTQLFINSRDNVDLDGRGFAPIGRVVQGMGVLGKLYKGYGDGAPRGAGPDQGVIGDRGNDYLKKSFPRLDYIKRAEVIP